MQTQTYTYQDYLKIDDNNQYELIGGELRHVGRMVIRQGEVYWVDLAELAGSEPGYRHPHVVIQNNVYNRSRIGTVIVCVITSNLSRAVAPGNVLLEADEANLPKQSVINVSQLFTIDKRFLGQRIGVLSKERVQQIIAGIRLVLEPRDIE